MVRCAAFPYAGNRHSEPALSLPWRAKNLVTGSSPDPLRRHIAGGALLRNSGDCIRPPLGSRLVLDGDELVAEAFRLSLEFGFEPALSVEVSGCPKGLVVFHLFPDERVEQNGDLVSGGRNGCLWAEFGLFPAQEVP